jgi:hypothetical protein
MTAAKDYYVYAAKHDGRVLYIGSGRQARIDHVNSGRSHNREINRHFFTYGPMVVEKLHTQLTRAESLRREVLAIDLLNPPHNVRKKDASKLTPPQLPKSFRWLEASPDQASA